MLIYILKGTILWSSTFNPLDNNLCTFSLWIITFIYVFVPLVPPFYCKAHETSLKFGLEHRNEVNIPNTKVEFNKTLQSMTLTPII